MARLFQMKALNYPIIKLTICFASGILISDFIVPTFQKLTYSLSTVFFLLIAANYYCKKQSKTLWWPSLLVLILFVTLGLFVSTVQAPVFHKSHYTHKQNIKENQVIDIEFIVIKKLLD